MSWSRRDFLASSTGAAIALSMQPAFAAVNPEAILVSSYGRTTSTLNWAIALKKNFFKDEGLSVKQIVPGGGGGASLRNMLAANIYYGVVATAAVVTAARSGVDLTIVNATNNSPGDIAVVTAAGRPYKSAKDLKGKKVGYSTAKSVTELLLRMVFEREGMLDQVELVATGGNVGTVIQALASGVVDATWMVDPTLTLESARFPIVFKTTDYFPRFEWGVGAAPKEVVKQHPDLLRAYIRVQRRSVEYMLAHQGEALEIYAEVWQKSKDEVEKLLPKFFKDPYYWTNGAFDKEGLEVLSRGLQLIGEIDKPVDWKSVIDQSFLPDDLKRPL